MQKKIMLCLVATLFLYNVSYADEDTKSLKTVKQKAAPIQKAKNIPTKKVISQSIPVSQIVPVSQKWKAVGLAGDEVIVTDGENILTVKDKAMMGDCYVLYPDIVCDKDKIITYKNKAQIVEKAEIFYTENRIMTQELANTKKQVEDLSNLRVKETETLLAKNQDLEKNIKAKEKEYNDLKLKLDSMNKDKDVLNQNLISLKKGLAAKDNEIKNRIKEQTDLNNNIEKIKKEALLHINRCNLEKDKLALPSWAFSPNWRKAKLPEINTIVQVSEKDSNTLLKIGKNDRLKSNKTFIMLEKISNQRYDSEDSIYLSVSSKYLDMRKK